MKQVCVAALLLGVVSLGCVHGLSGPHDNTVVALRPTELQVLPEFNLTFVGVEQDSRCAASVTCVWAGNAQVAITTVVPGLGIASAKQFLNTNIEPRSLEAYGVVVRLDSLKPAPVTADPIPQSQYTAYFTIVRR